jgi:hypothetical protein
VRPFATDFPFGPEPIFGIVAVFTSAFSKQLIRSGANLGFL